MKIKIISLGEIVTPDIMKTISAFTSLIAGKKASANIADVGKAIGGVLHHNMNLINAFKFGQINENDFTDSMIAALESATQIRLTPAEFDQAWKAMHPQFSQFESLLIEAIEHNNQPGQKVVFISATNPKDMKNLIEQLNINGQEHVVENDQLTKIGGISLFTTHTAKKTKAELIESVIRSLHPTPSSTLFATAETPTIEFIRSVNNMADPVLKADLDHTNQQIEQQAAHFAVTTIIWNKAEQQTLSDVLNNRNNPVIIRLPANAL